ncbi:MAG TPA: 30S ribosomal protein S1 [Candidatus Avilachnospira avicola]|nr:30S ribosomal protein S1 [Candidatus Avilachnospira avicola]
MSEMSFEDMLNESFKTIRTGEVVTGKVIDVKPDYIIVNIGYKSDGIITRNDYSADSSLDLTAEVKPGDEIEAKVRKVNDGEGLVSLSHRDVISEKSNQRIKEAFENKELITGKVDRVVNGGLSVIFEGVRIFIPASLVSDMFERDLSKYAGTDIEFVITEFNPQKHRIIGDRKHLILERKAAAKEALLATIKEGDVIDGTVKNITDFGAFVDLGGADGLLHISEMSWGRTENPKKVYKPGQELRVMIKEINGDKIALTRKFPDENPWVLALTKYAVGNIVRGRVARLADFGAFVNLEPGIDALLHVSQISSERVEKPSDVLKVGDEIVAKVTELNAADKKISLSIKALNAPEHEHKEAPKEEDVVSVYTDSDDEEIVEEVVETAAEETEETSDAE